MLAVRRDNSGENRTIHCLPLLPDSESELELELEFVSDIQLEMSSPNNGRIAVVVL